MKKFKDYGLMIDKNFISMPNCECGCGGKCKVKTNEITGFCFNTLIENESPNSAIFVDGLKHNYAVVKHIGKHYPSDRALTEDEFYNFDPLYKYDDVFVDEGRKYGVTIDAVEFPSDIYDLFNRYVDMFKFDNYGIVVEESEDVWAAVEE